MGKDTSLQKYNYETKTWNDAANGSAITNGAKGTIMQDSSGNIRAMSAGSKLQVYDPATQE